MSSGETRFLNVDLELITRGKIAPLLDQWSEEIVVLRNSAEAEGQTVWLELGVEQRDVEHVLLAFLELVGKLPDDVRKAWDGCDDRCFNVGVQAGLSPHSSTYSISPRTLARIAAVKARVAFTIYAPMAEENAGNARAAKR